MCISKARAIALRASTLKGAKARADIFFSNSERLRTQPWSVIRMPASQRCCDACQRRGPKVAPYPFTTLHPIIGVVELQNYLRATVADIPGLIEGAHLNLGLGHDFLRHITRCGLFLFVLDMGGSEGRSPIADLQSLRRELDLYDSRLSGRPWFVIANKMDLPGASENLDTFRTQFPQLTLVPISAKKGTGIGEVKQLLEKWIVPAPEEEKTIPARQAINR